MATYKQLSAQLEQLQDRIEHERARAVAQAIAEIRARIKEYDITAEELGFAPLTAKSVAAPAKYRNPETGETWSGRGRAPHWLGADRTRFLIHP